MKLLDKVKELRERISAHLKTRRAKARQERLDNSLLVSAEFSVKSVGKLLAKGANPNMQNDGRTPLGVAIGKGRLDVAAALLAAGASPDSVLPHQAPLHQAIRYGNRPLFDLLLEHGASLEKKLYYGETPLMVAVSTGRRAMAEALLDRGADVNAVDENGATALFLAIARRDRRMVEKLIEKGARTDIITRDMTTPLQHARTHMEAGIFNLLQAKADSEVPPWQKTGEQEIAAVSVKRAIGYKITEIFNFETSRYTAITQDLKTNATSAVMREFGELKDRTQVEKAREALRLAK